jgi:hypothetical protein
MSVIFAIDSYLSTQERADTCKNLISQIRKAYPDKKILMINKFRESWGIDKLVDFYYFHGEGFLVGAPPKHILESGKYERPYTYFQIPNGTLENWFPLVNVSDHVADVFNSFIITASIAKTLGYKKVYKIEYDTIFDEGEFLSMSQDIESFKDYLIYGTRKEGTWAKNHQYLIDVHNIGYDVNLFEGFEILKNDEDFWNLCKKINYYGKWIEYVIPAVIEFQRNLRVLTGIEYNQRVDFMFPKTKFDAINSPGEWGSTWNEIPKVCRVSNTSDNQHAAPNQLVFFYVGNKNFAEGEEYVEVSCQVQSLATDEMLYDRKTEIRPNAWLFDQIHFYEPIKIMITNKSSACSTYKEYVLSPNDIDNINPRFVFNT